MIPWLGIVYFNNVIIVSLKIKIEGFSDYFAKISCANKDYNRQVLESNHVSIVTVGNCVYSLEMIFENYDKLTWSLYPIFWCIIYSF